MAKMRVVQAPEAKAPFEIVDREVPEPVSGTVRIKIQACGAGTRSGGFVECRSRTFDVRWDHNV
jgi:hypothetical protein